MKGPKRSTYLTLGPEPTTLNVQTENNINQDLQSKTDPSKIETLLTSEKGPVKSYCFSF